MYLTNQEMFDAVAAELAGLNRTDWRCLDILGTRGSMTAGELAKAEPKRLRYRLLHTAGRLAFHGRRAQLRLQRTWPWAGELASAFARLQALPGPAG